MTILGTRPEIIRMSEVIKACDKNFDFVLVHTGQNWDHSLNQIFFEELGLRKADYYLSCAGKNAGETIGNILSKSYDIISQVKPDALLILGDTNSGLSAIAAKRLKVPIFHMEAGNRCFDENVPEEINRRIIDHIADVNLPYTEHSRRYLLSEGLRKEHIFVTGSPLHEVLEKQQKKIESSSILEKLGLAPDDYMVASIHREENIENEKTFFSIMNAVNNVAESYKKAIVYSVHPRSKKAIEKRKFEFSPYVHCMEPFGFFDYNKLQKNALCVLSDSGTLSEESALLGFPAVLLRTSTERPEALEKGTVVIGGIRENELQQAIEVARAVSKKSESSPIPDDYKDKKVSQKVVRIIQSYTQIINRTVWKK